METDEKDEPCVVEAFVNTRGPLVPIHGNSPVRVGFDGNIAVPTDECSRHYEIKPVQGGVAVRVFSKTGAILMEGVDRRRLSNELLELDPFDLMHAVFFDDTALFARTRRGIVRIDNCHRFAGEQDAPKVWQSSSGVLVAHDGAMVFAGRPGSVKFASSSERARQTSLLRRPDRPAPALPRADFVTLLDSLRTPGHERAAVDAWKHGAVLEIVLRGVDDGDSQVSARALHIPAAHAGDLRARVGTKATMDLDKWLAHACEAQQRTGEPGFVSLALLEEGIKPEPVAVYGGSLPDGRGAIAILRHLQSGSSGIETDDDFLLAALADLAAGDIRTLPRRVFISYTGKDESVARSLEQSLKAAGMGVQILPGSHRPGGAVREEVERAIAGCDAAVVLLSEASLLAPWVTAEIFALEEPARARQLQRKIVVARLQSVELPLPLNPLCPVDLFAMDSSAHGAAVVEALRGAEVLFPFDVLANLIANPQGAETVVTVLRPFAALVESHGARQAIRELRRAGVQPSGTEALSAMMALVLGLSLHYSSSPALQSTLRFDDHWPLRYPRRPSVRRVIEHKLPEIARLAGIQAEVRNHTEAWTAAAAAFGRIVTGEIP